MTRHHHETNPHFVRLPSQDQQLGSPSSPPSSPPRRRHGPWSDPAGRPAVRIKSRAPPPGSQRRGSLADQPGQSGEPPSAGPLPLSREEPAPIRYSPRSGRPLLLSPEEPPHPNGYRPPPTPSLAKPWPRRAAESPPPQHGGPRIPPPKKTNAITWSGAVCCAIFWVILILAGLIVLIVYLVYRPHSPYFDISTANLNAAYLDMGFLLNADLALFANFTNPSKKSSVDFSFVNFELYHYNTLIATQYVEPFSVPKSMSMFLTVHMVSSQVPLPLTESQVLQKQIDTGPVLLNVRGTFHARSNLGSLFRYSYWIHSHCSVSLNSPPTGTMRGRRCNAKR